MANTVTVCKPIYEHFNEFAAVFTSFLFTKHIKEAEKGLEVLFEFIANSYKLEFNSLKGVIYKNKFYPNKRFSFSGSRITHPRTVIVPANYNEIFAQAVNRLDELQENKKRLYGILLFAFKNAYSIDKFLEYFPEVYSDLFYSTQVNKLLQFGMFPDIYDTWNPVEVAADSPAVLKHQEALKLKEEHQNFLKTIYLTAKLKKII